MKKQARRLSKSSIPYAGVIALSLIAAPLFVTPISKGEFSFLSTANAAEDSSSGHKGGNPGAGKGTPRSGGQGADKGKKDITKVLGGGEDSDSDRPEWAGGSKELNPHSGTPNPTPGIKKGGDYGDLWVVVRDPVTGAPILVDGEYQVCVDPACTTTVLTVDGELPEGTADVAEVELGRANIVRSPDKVTDKALDTVLTKLTSATTVTTDMAGRLVIDGVTIDSPLENLALYIALMTSDPKLTPVLDKLPADTTSLAASLLAAGSDKTGSITIDYVVYGNVIMDIVENDVFYNYGTFDYNRDTTYSGTITYYVQAADGTITQVTKPILEAVFGGESYVSTDGAGISDFVQAADDALQVIEFTHTEVHIETTP